MLETEYGLEIWSLYAAGSLDAHTRLTGTFDRSVASVDMGDLMAIIDAAREEERERLEVEREWAEGPRE